MPPQSTAFVRLTPILFVVLWSTGWIVAGFAAPHADPLTFLVVRFLTAAGCILPFALAVRAPWPRRPAEFGHALVSGILIHAVYLGAVWWAVGQGLPAGISALIAAAQPVMTALMAPALLGERIGPRQWAGIALGFLGIVLVLAPKLVGLAPDRLWPVALPMAVNLAGMLAVTLGTFYQKRFVATADLRTTTVVQYVGAAVVLMPVAMALEDLRIVWNATMLAVLAWSVLAISLGAIALLLILIRRGAVSRAAALVYLVPPVAAIQAYVLLGETLTAVQVAGMAVTTAGVWLATRTR